MKTSTIILALLFICCSCQVEKKDEIGEVIVGHKNYPNAFTVDTPSAQTYYNGDTLQVTLRFPVAVNVDTTSGYPYLLLDFGGTQVWADYVSGDGMTQLIFEYPITSMDFDNNGIDVVSLAANGAIITYNGGGLVNTVNTNISNTHFANIKINAP